MTLPSWYEALSLNEYLVQHAVACFAVLARDNYSDSALPMRILAWLARSGGRGLGPDGRTVTHSQVYAAFKKGQARGPGGSKKVAEALQTLVDYGWIRPLGEVGRGTAGGRPAVSYRLHKRLGDFYSSLVESEG